MAGNENSGNRGTPKNKTPIIKEKEILSHLKEGKGIRETAALSKVSKTTVERIRYENVEDLPKWRKKTAENMMRVQTKLLDKLEDSVDELEPSAKSLASLSISIGIISDKLKDNLQTGQQTIEHKHIHINHSDVNLLLGDVKAPNPNKTSEKVENTKENELFN
tara:strand:+ start:20820 stop:21308 length:489 start_codon:yes stop_codon:yes gene_type:complete